MANYHYDKSDIFEMEIEPLLSKIQQICNENKIPYFAAFGVAMNSKGKFVKGTGIRCNSLIPEVLSIPNEDSFFAEFVNILNGAHTTYAQSQFFDVDDFNG